MRIFPLFLCFLFSISYSSRDIAAEELEVVVGWDKPPYVLSADHSGFEMDLVRAIFAEIGHEISPIYVPFGRTARLLKDDNVDVALTINSSHKVDAALLTDAYIIYQNVAVSRADRALTVNSFDDLTDKSVIAFQTASAVLGEEFGGALSSLPTYMEMARQDRQVNMLMLGSVDVIVLDRNIFNFLKGKNERYADDETVFHELFPITPYRAAIPDKTLREAFNRTLRTFIDDGRYQALLDKYGLENLFGKLQLPVVHP
jgi:polar amino acid transport system substrate-binding protein